MRKMAVLTAALALCLVGGSQARASSITSNFTVGNPDIQANNTVSPPYATLTVNGDTTRGLVTFDLTVLAPNSASFHDLGFNLAKGVAFSNFTLVGTAGTLKTNKNMDGFGDYAVQYDYGSSASDRTTQLLFTLQMNPGSYNLAQASNFFGPNTGHAGNSPFTFYYAAHYFPATGGTGTGFIGATNSLAAAPEPASLSLLGLCAAGLMVYGGLRRIRTAAFAG
jgi:hypothetical protein